MNTLYIEPECGVAGDMLVAALLQLDGALPISQLQENLRSLKIKEKWSIELQNVQRHSLSSALFVVNVQEHHHHHDDSKHHHHHGRTLPEINDIISAADKISDNVKKLAFEVFANLAKAEALVHGKDYKSVHFHEVGAVDAIIDIVSACALIESLNPQKIISSPVALGTGNTNSAHGVLPVPVPATVNILKGIPVKHTGINSELATPTGAALLATFVDEWATFPEGVLLSVSYGAGTRDLKEKAAVVRTSIYENNSPNTDKIAVIETNLDDMSGEIFSWISDKLLEMKALDYALIPIQMKKNRPGILLQILCKPSELARFADFVLKNTTSIGIRYRIEDRIILKREIRKEKTPLGEVILKVALDENNNPIKSKIEYENCAELADKNNCSFIEMQNKLKNIMTPLI